MKQRIFISSVQKEFADERQALKAYILGDAMLSRFFDVFLFKDIPASDRRANAVYIERMGTGTGDMIERCRNVGLAEPEFSLTDGFVITLRRKPGRAFVAIGGKTQPESRPESARMTGQFEAPVTLFETDRAILAALRTGERGRKDILQALGHTQRSGNFKPSIEKLMKHVFIERTLPDRPNSRLQKYRLTAKGKALLATLARKGRQA
jgi:predicted HTH transcriptional regulator